MIKNLAELNRVVLAIKTVRDNEKGNANYEAVKNQCESIIIGGGLPDHDLSISFAQSIGLVYGENGELVLTENGNFFLDFNPKESYELSEEQKRLLIRMCYLHGSLRLQTLKLIKSFSPNYEEKTFRLSLEKYEFKQNEDWLLDHLVQLNLVIRDENFLEINEEYVDTISSFMSEGRGWTENSLIEYLKERKEIGNIAENIILNFEKKRLMNSGFQVESVSIRDISKLRVDAGYDIESFDGKSTNLNYDRFIEVKGAKDARIKFFWSDNEIKKAKIFGEKYWIYFQGGIDVEKRIAKNEPLLFQNPIKTILKNSLLKKTPQGIIIEGNLRGNLINLNPN